MLRSGGGAYLTTPNFASLTRRVLGPRWRIISYPEHLRYFTGPTLVQAALETGFEVARVSSSGISPKDVVYGLSGGRIATEGQGGGGLGRGATSAG